MRRYSLHFFISAVTLFISILSFPVSTEAARIFLEAEISTIGVGQRFEVSVYVHSEGETVNAFAGTIHLPSLITLRAIRDGDSLIALWSKRPEIFGNNIVFAGIVPGGWKGSHGYLLSFVVEASFEGEDTIDFSDVDVLLHDGKGTPAPVLLEPLSLSISEDTALTEFVEDIKDNEPPEVFALSISRTNELFSGDAFLVFTAQDKGSGIDHYEILETRKKLRDETKGEWEYVKSPYRLNDQSLKSFVYVRAVDRAGNVRVSIYVSEERETTALTFVVFVLILFLVLGVFFLRKKHP